MQRPRNRQPRPATQNPPSSQTSGNSNFSSNNPRSRRNRGRGRGNRTEPDPSTPYPSSVPTTTQVIRNANVSIVLKEDQGTGREVHGLVQDVLTSGNHPRGIKVRLMDGRVGRVQRIVREGEVLVGVGGNEDRREGDSSFVRGERRGGAFTDVRESGYEEGPREGGFSLGDFLVNPAQKRILGGDEEGVERGDGELERMGEDSQVCPVCGEFEGDEVAVSRHVGEHFD